MKMALNSDPIYINDYAYISAVDSFNTPSHYLRFNATEDVVAALHSDDERQLSPFIEKNAQYKPLDRTTQLALYTASKLKETDKNTLVNIGSSRGATGLWEQYYDEFKNHSKTSPYTSPLTTLGNTSSWVAQYLNIDHAAFSHSITCATASHAILNSIAWIKSGMAIQAIAGGTEAPLTAFTIAQMKALRIYTDTDSLNTYPSRPLDLEKKSNTMVLGEGAALFNLSQEKNLAIASIIGYGTAVEKLTTATSMTKEGSCIEKAMSQACAAIDLRTIDAIITHTPGTIKGDNAEFNAIKKVFGQSYPRLCNNKWQIGHTLGASAGLSLAMAIEMLQSGSAFTIPYLTEDFVNTRGDDRDIKRVLINAAGFGGNAVSLLVEKAL